MFKLKNRWLYIALLALYSFLNIRFTGGDQLVGIALPDWHLALVILLMVLMLWEGNRLLQSFIGTPASKIHPLILFFLASIALVVVISVLPLLIIPGGISGFNEEFKLTLAFAFRVNLFLHCINAIVFYINRLKDAQIETQKLKRQTVEAQFEALRNQINPHFLFNSFNVLSNLVYKNADTSAEFIQQLSEVYRYLIYHQENKLVPLRQELDFIKSYLYLLQIRFSENLKVEMDLPQNLNGFHVPPVSIQLLIENAIKHNILSESQPLSIELGLNEDYLSVTNNLQLKSTTDESTGVGLNNIVKRCEFLTDRPVQIENNDRSFTVSIPLIHLTNESTDR